MIAKLVRSALLGRNPVPQYAVVGVRQPQRKVRVELRGIGSPLDVTNNNVVASLSPLRIAVALSQDSARILKSTEGAHLAFIEQERSGRNLGQIGISLEDTRPLGANVLCIFRTGKSINHCVSKWKSIVYEQYRSWSARRRKDRYNHQMSRGDLQSFLVFYTCPRPVALITIYTGDGGNIFPMDLIGPAGGSYFLLALHNTAPSVERIKRIGRLAVSHVPIDMTEAVYELGKNHRVADIDWDTLPVPVQRSPIGDWPIPRSALLVSEVSVDETYDMGSHTLFVTRVTAEERLAEGLRMCHIQGFYQDYLRQQGEGF